jgi:hypothetical protein
VETSFSVEERSFELLVTMEGERIQSKLALMVDGGEKFRNAFCEVLIIGMLFALQVVPVLNSLQNCPIEFIRGRILVLEFLLAQKNSFPKSPSVIDEEKAKHRFNKEKKKITISLPKVCSGRWEKPKPKPSC